MSWSAFHSAARKSSQILGVEIQGRFGRQTNGTTVQPTFWRKDNNTIIATGKSQKVAIQKLEEYVQKTKDVP